MFQVEHHSPLIFEKVLTSIEDLIKDANFECKDEGIEINAFDSSIVSIVSLSLYSGGFDMFKCERNQTLGIKISELIKILKCSKKHDSFKLRRKHNSDFIGITFTSPNQEQISNFELRLMDLHQDHFDIPDVHYGCKIIMSSVEFTRTCRNLSQFGENISISCSNSELTFKVCGDFGVGCVKWDAVERSSNESLDNNTKQSIIIEIQQPIKMVFSCRYLNLFTKPSHLSREVQLSMSENCPLCVEYTIPDHLGKIRYYLSEQIEKV